MTNFKKDLFISYAHIDNEPLTPEQKGWITRFHASLEALLSMRLGSKVRIWRDDKLQGNDVFADEIVEQFSHTAVLVSILTPRYLKSEWCTREVTEFCNNAELTGGLIFDNKARVFKVLKTPVETQDALPDVVQGVLGYEFFTMEDGTPLELDAAYGETFAQDYNRKVGKLAWDISQLLKTLTVESTEIVPESDGKPTVYLAECSYDRKQDREILEGELLRFGYTVLPGRELPRGEDEYVAAVTSLLERSGLSIHLIGDTYGSVPDGPSQKSTAVLQNEIASGLSESAGLKRLIWLRAGMTSDQNPQQDFINSLVGDAAAQRGADLIAGGIEELKISIHGALKKLEEAEPSEDSEIAAEKGPQHIYLICVEEDRKATVPLRKFFRSKGFEVSIPAFEGDAAAIREAHRQQLSGCDAVIVFYGVGPESWKRIVESDLKKMPAYRAGKPLPAKFTYLSDPKTNDKDDLIDMGESDLINGLGEFSEGAMDAFFTAVKPEVS